MSSRFHTRGVVDVGRVVIEKLFLEGGWLRGKYVELRVEKPNNWVVL